MTKEIKTEIVEKLNQSFDNVNFNEAAHLYTNKNTGEKLWGVTTILSQFNTYKFANIPQAIMQNKAQIGKMVHDYAEAKFYNQKLDLSALLEKYDPLSLWGAEFKKTVLGYASAVDLWFKQFDHNFDRITTEIKFADKTTNLAGTADVLAFKKGTLEGVILDYKTSASIDKWIQPLQLAAYAEMINNIIGCPIFNHGILVQLKPGGSYETYEFALREYFDRWHLAKLNFDVNIVPLLKKK